MSYTLIFLIRKINNKNLQGPKGKPCSQLHNPVLVKLSWFLGQSSAHRGVSQLSRFFLFAWLQIQNYWSLYSSSTTNTDLIKAQRWRRTWWMITLAFVTYSSIILSLPMKSKRGNTQTTQLEKWYLALLCGQRALAKNTGTSQWLRQGCLHSLEPGAELH